MIRSYGGNWGFQVSSALRGMKYDRGATLPGRKGCSVAEPGTYAWTAPGVAVAKVHQVFEIQASLELARFVRTDVLIQRWQLPHIWVAEVRTVGRGA